MYTPKEGFTPSPTNASPTFDVTNGLREEVQELLVLVPLLLPVGTAGGPQHVPQVDSMHGSTCALVHLHIHTQTHTLHKYTQTHTCYTNTHKHIANSDSYVYVSDYKWITHIHVWLNMYTYISLSRLCRSLFTAFNTIFSMYVCSCIFLNCYTRLSSGVYMYTHTHVPSSQYNT